MMNRTRQVRGFTLVELMLAMTFLSMLLLAIALLVMQITNIYTKGVTLTAVDRAGQAVSSELQRAINQTSSDKVVYTVVGDSAGRLCLGGSTYVWNYGSALNSVDENVNKYDGVIDSREQRNIHFVKIVDQDGSLCTPGGEDGALPLLPRDRSTELLQGADRDLVLHHFEIHDHTLSSGQKLYSIGLVLGTNGLNDIMSDTQQCKAPSGGNNNFCAINRLEFNARSGNVNDAEAE